MIAACTAEPHPSMKCVYIYTYNPSHGLRGCLVEPRVTEGLADIAVRTSKEKRWHSGIPRGSQTW